jgi:hypothetical protein
MTIIAEQAQDTRAKRRINPSFRPDDGPLPHGKPKAFPVDLKNQKGQRNTWESGQQRSTPNASFACLFRGFYNGLEDFRARTAAHRFSHRFAPL